VVYPASIIGNAGEPSDSDLHCPKSSWTPSWKMTGGTRCVAILPWISLGFRPLPARSGVFKSRRVGCFSRRRWLAAVRGNTVGLPYPASGWRIPAAHHDSTGRRLELS